MTSTFTDPLHGKLFFEIEDTKRGNDEEDAEFDVVIDDDAAIAPEFTPADAVGSALVATVMPLESPAVAAPMVRPDNVMVQVALAAIVCIDVMMTKLVVELEDTPPVMHPLAYIIIPLEEAKKSDGYVSVM